MNKKRKRTMNRSHYLLYGTMINLRKGTSFQKLFHKWYVSNSDIVPNRVYDYIVGREL